MRGSFKGFLAIVAVSIAAALLLLLQLRSPWELSAAHFPLLPEDEQFRFSERIPGGGGDGWRCLENCSSSQQRILEQGGRQYVQSTLEKFADGSHDRSPELRSPSLNLKHRDSGSDKQRYFEFLKRDASPYHDWNLFQRDYNEMIEKFRVFVYPEVYAKGKAFSKVFGPHRNPFDPKLGNYFSEHMFKLNLLNSSFLTSNPDEAHFFFLPFSVNALRNDPRVRTDESIADFVAHYVNKISMQFEHWNRSQGTDHFYACCHSVGRNAASKVPFLQRNSVQVVCSASYYHKFYVPHKDIAMPQIWPREVEISIVPPKKRTRLAFYAGRAQNSKVRGRLLDMWKNDSDMDIHSGSIHGSYEEAFQNSKFCIHVKGYEVNTARIADAIHFGCVPVIISDHYDLPFGNVLDWEQFSIILSHVDIPSLKSILLSVSDNNYRRLHKNVCQVRKHFQWQVVPSEFDSFYMTMHQLWLRRHFVRSLQHPWTANNIAF